MRKRISYRQPSHLAWFQNIVPMIVESSWAAVALTLERQRLALS